ncbi:MAG: DUF2213 domain-containing protein [Xenococcus sp. (in: cyanobacteria)]
MKRSFRTDAIKIDNVVIDGAGILRARAKIARIGVQEYYEDGKVIRELRLPDDVIASAESFSSQVVTLNHPEVMVDSKNAAQYSKGLSGDAVDYIDGWLKTHITVTHEDAVQAARTTHKQFSNGYWARLEETSGVWIDELGVQGKPGTAYEYDRIQRDIVGNHIALVQAARAGDRATFCDSLDFIIDQDDQITSKNIKLKDNFMVQIVYDNRILEIDGKDADKVASILDSLKADLSQEKNDALDVLGEKDQKIDELQTTNSELRAKNDSLTEAIEELKANQMNPDWFELTMNTRVELWGEVMQLDSVDAIDPKLDETGIKKLGLYDYFPNLKEKIDAGDEVYINTLWDMRQDFPREETTKNEVVASILEDSQEVRNDSNPYSRENARKAFIDARTHK